MFLRSLSIRGFKSFADKTVLEFTPGISVIVGPNGSGKSNLVDAISWVLGEQGPRALRGGQMADVIFAGSPNRPALGMAEVRLVIDNSAGLIPVPMSEIEVSRTIFRSGDSEYRIGGQPCRLLDVQELLSESGIGRALHTVVGQGQLEDVLQARPEDRRKYIEEAAGIAKHRKRKERAERKLVGLDQDLLRLQDVLTELRRQLKPLKQQAEMAKRHEDLSAEAEDLSMRIAAARLRALREDRSGRQAGWDAGLEARREARERLDSLDLEVIAVAERRAAATAAFQEAEAVWRTAEQERSGAEVDLRRTVDREAAVRSELAAEATRTVRLTAVEEEIAGVKVELEEVSRALEQREVELSAAEGEFRQTQDARRAAEDERRRVSEEAAAHRAEMESIRRSLSAYERDRARIESSLAEIRVRRAGSESERERLEAEIESLDSDASPLSDRRALLEAERKGIAEKVADLEEAIRRHGSRRELLEARRRDIEETPGSRFLASHRGRAIGLLRDLVRSEAGLEKALLAALGPLADAVVYESEGEALIDAPDGDGAILAVAGGGPVAFKLPGERSLLSTVSAEPSARGLASTVLRDVYMAGSLDEAVAKHRQHPRAAFVTPGGVLVGDAVILTAAEADERAREIRAELAVVEHDLAAAQAAVRPREKRLAEIAAETEDLASRIDEADASITKAAEALDRLSSQLATSAKEEELLVERLAGLDEAAEIWRRQLVEAEPVTHELPELPRVAEPPMQARVAVETLRRERAAGEVRLERFRSELAVLASQDPAALKAALETAEDDRAQAERRLVAAASALLEATAVRDEQRAEERAAAEEEADVNLRWREVSGSLERLREEYEEEDRARGDLERRVLEQERLLREGHQRDPEEAVAALGPDDTVESLSRRAELVQRRLGLLGRVNLLASGEFEVLQERHDFLARELEDVRKARRDLLEVIARIEEEITTTFDAAFRDVATEFEKLIADLFPGGEGRLQLLDPAEPLTSGIEIEARPGRKRVRRISLLSGGERALVAMAFLFAIFKARPSPFYLMDEVEPALDDVNLHRFLRLVEGFAADSQVLIVTHQKRTMEVAAMMYGISMHKDGTTKVVCQRMDQRTPASAANAPGVGFATEKAPVAVAVEGEPATAPAPVH